MKIIVDMNLTPDWVPFLESHGWETLHWMEVGDKGATDREIMEWATNNSCTVFTHDLDFGALLAATQATGPSVIQARAHDVLPSQLGKLLVNTIDRYQHELEP